MIEIARIFAETTGGLEREVFCERRRRVFADILAQFPGRGNEGDGYVEIRGVTRADVAAARRAGRNEGVAVRCTVIQQYTRTELARARLLRLCVEGEPVDTDDSGAPLNIWPTVLCRKCEMPDEAVLPLPFRFSMKAAGCERATYWGEDPPSRRGEVFSAACGVLVVSSRVRELVAGVLGDTALWGQAYPAVPSRGAALHPMWALRPRRSWGVQKGREEWDTCDSCGRALVARMRRDEDDPFLDGKLEMLSAEEPPAGILLACSGGWFGDRRVHPGGMWRDVLVSGRLCGMLLGHGVRGLHPSVEPVWWNGRVPMDD